MRRRLVFVFVVLGALALASSAGSTIVLQKSIGGVALGASKAKVTTALGKPTRTKKGTNDFGPYTILYFKGYQVNFQGDSTVTQIETTLTTERTAGGIGVGSTKAQVRSKVKAVKCEGPANEGHCYLGAYLPGRTITDFWLKNGRVSRVVVGYVID